MRTISAWERSEERSELNDGAKIPGGYMLHSPAARTTAARLAVFHCAVMGIVVAICAVDIGRFDTLMIAALVDLAVWSVLVAYIPWGRFSHNWLAKIYFLGAGWFIFFAIRFHNPYLLLGIYPEMVVFADAYWYRRSLLALHELLLIGGFAISAFVIGGDAVAALTLIALPMMTASALIVGAISHRFIQALMQHQQFQSAVTALLEALHARDGYTGDHSKETLAMAMAVADQMGIGDSERKLLGDVALLHDIGKIGIPNSILQKPGELTEEEWVTMRQHPVIGEQILLEIPGFEAVANAVRHEHERWDGLGYPDGIANTEIPLASRVVFVCDAFHAMTSNRPYRIAMSVENARAELREHAGSQFDPVVVAALDSTIERGVIGRYADDEHSPLTAIEPGGAAGGGPAVIGATLSLGESAADASTEVTLSDPPVMITMTGANWALTAVVMCGYLLVKPPFDLFGAAFVALAAAISVLSVFLRGHGAPKAWSLYTCLFAYLAIPVTALHYDQPAMLMFLLGPAAMASGFFWHRMPIRIAQIVLVIVEFVALPVVLFGMKLLPMAATGARAFPGALLVVGYFTQKLLKMRFERRRFSGTMTSLLLALQSRDGYTSEHSDATLEMAMLVADQMQLGESERLELKDIALLHDIGKIGIPDEILNKPGALDGHEWEIMRRHSTIGEQIVGRVPGFESVARAIRHEHERWDGSGYPDGISGERIPLASRVVLVCDAFHAMTSDRPYRKALSAANARAELVSCAGSQFDPRVVGALLAALDEQAAKTGASPRPVLVRAA